MGRLAHHLLPRRYYPDYPAYRCFSFLCFVGFRALAVLPVFILTILLIHVYGFGFFFLSNSFYSS